MSIKIMLDAGHGAGADYNRGSKYGNEGDNNFNFSLLLKKELEKYGFYVGLTRPTQNVGSNQDLKRRGQLGKGYDLFLSLHSNAGGGTGVEIWNSVTKGDSTLANLLCEGLSKVQNIKNRGVKYKKLEGTNLDWFGVLRYNAAKKGMLIEHCFHDNAPECKFYYNNMELIAKKEAEIIAKYYGIKEKTQGDDEMLDVIVTCISDGDVLKAVDYAVMKNYPFMKANNGILPIKAKKVIQIGGNGTVDNAVKIAGNNRIDTFKEIAKNL